MIFEGIKYVVSKPESFKENLEYPTVIFMHGAGTRGDDINQVFNNPFFQKGNILLEKTIIYAPLCDQDTWFDMFEGLRRFARYVYEHKNTDITRVYLVGASMGGYAVWQLMMSDPQLYAGAVPICGGGMYWNAERLKNSNIWAFHGKKDSVVLCEESTKMVDCINKYGGKAKLTILEEYEHNVWTYVYQNPQPFQWLLECKNEKINAGVSNSYDSSERFG